MAVVKGKKFKKAMALFLGVLLAFGCAPLSLATAPDVAAAPDQAQHDTFQAELEAAVSRAFVGLADRLGPEIVAAITPDVEAISAEIELAVKDVKEKKDSLETTGFKMDFSSYPSAEEINRIPEKVLDQVRAEVAISVREGIAKDFAKSETEITEQVVSLMKEAAPGIIQKFEPSLKALIPKIHGIIESNIEASIQKEILLVMKDLMKLIPDDMANLSPEEIAARMKAVIRPKIESVVRPEFEAKIKEQVDALMIEKIKKPIEEKFNPRLASLDASAYDKYIDKLPGYLERVISKETIKSIVRENVTALKNRLPSIVENARGDLDSQINEYITKTIENEAKVYIGQSYVKAPIQPVEINDRLLVPFRAIATALGASVEWRYKEQQVVMTKGDKTIVLTIDSNVVIVNGEEKTLDVQTMLAPDYSDPNISHTVVPLRFIAETFDMDVNWQQDWKMVTIGAKS